MAARAFPGIQSCSPSTGLVDRGPERSWKRLRRSWNDPALLHTRCGTDKQSRCTHPTHTSLWRHNPPTCWPGTTRSGLLRVVQVDPRRRASTDPVTGHRRGVTRLHRCVHRDTATTDRGTQRHQGEHRSRESRSSPMSRSAANRSVQSRGAIPDCPEMTPSCVVDQRAQYLT
jgi:hypothetical protein